MRASHSHRRSSLLGRGFAASMAFLTLMALMILTGACGGDSEPSDSSTDNPTSSDTSLAPEDSDGDTDDVTDDNDDGTDAVTTDDSDDEDPSEFRVADWPPEPIFGEGPIAGIDDSGTPGTRIGRLPLPETSALIASPTEDGLYWTIQDRSENENRAMLLGFRVDDGELDEDFGPDGDSLLRVAIDDVANVDWETLAVAPDGSILIGDLGNNNCRRDDQKVLVVDEPGTEGESERLKARWQLNFPDTAEVCGGKNAEASMTIDNSYFVLAKTEPPVLYRLTDGADGENDLERLGPIAQPSGGYTRLVTGMSINDEGTRVVVTTAGERFWVYDIDRTGGDATIEDDVIAALATTPPQWSRRYDGSPDTQIEGAAFVNGSDDLLLIGEGRDVWLWPAEIYEEGVLG